MTKFTNKQRAPKRELSPAKRALREYKARLASGEASLASRPAPKAEYDFPPARIVPGGAPGSSRRR